MGWLQNATRPILGALTSGVLLGLSQPVLIAGLSERPLDPTGLSGLLSLIAFVPLLVTIDALRVRSAYWTAFLSLFTGMSIILYWLVIAMTVFGRLPLLVSILALSLLTATIAFWMSTSFAVSRLLVRRFRLPLWLVFPSMLAASELLRNYGPIGGFPWGTPSQALASVPLLLQGASLVGGIGLTVWVGLVNACLAELVLSWRDHARLVRAPLIALVVTTLPLLAWGSYRLHQAPDARRTVKVALLQGNIEQGIKNSAAQNATYIEQRYHELQAEALDQGAEVVVWPEAALPMSVRLPLDHLRSSGVVPRGGDLGDAGPPAAVIGAVAFEKIPGAPSGQRGSYRHYNTALVTGADLTVLGRFDKRHLVPFGEYVPWPLAAIVRQIVPGGGTTPGAPWQSLDLPIGDGSVRVGVTICYEGIFPEITRAFVDDGAELMFNVTNDAWYGVSSAPVQHLAFYAMRAAETGRAVARASNTGISAVIDTRGRLLAQTELYETTTLLAEVPVSTERTPYVLLREWVALPATVLGIALWIYALLGAGFWQRQRGAVEWVTGAVGIALAVFAVLTYFGMPSLYGDEGAANRASVGCAGSLLVGIGAWSGRPWGRTAQLWVGGLSASLCGLGALSGSLGAGIVALLGLSIAVLAWRRKHAYVRPADPERLFEDFTERHLS